VGLATEDGGGGGLGGDSSWGAGYGGDVLRGSRRQAVGERLGERRILRDWPGSARGRPVVGGGGRAVVLGPYRKPYQKKRGDANAFIRELPLRPPRGSI
jgi:hypothetical protein